MKLALIFLFAFSTALAGKTLLVETDEGNLEPKEAASDYSWRFPGFTIEVSCGHQKARTCSGCPQGRGPRERWCNGDCTWVDNKCKKKGGCFAPTSTVETREGVKTMDELLIGDEIRTSENNLDNTGFTEFLGWLDRQKSSPAKMLQLFAADNYPAVTLTASHVVFTTNSTKYAGDLVPGDTLLHWDGVKMEELEITEIKPSLESGFWAPLTRSGTLLVNGFLMSCYASYPHKVSDVAMAPIKAMPMILLDDQESQHKDGVRKTISFLKGMGQLFGARKDEGFSEKVPMNLGSFVNPLKYDL